MTIISSIILATPAVSLISHADISIPGKICVLLFLLWNAIENTALC